MSRPPSSCSASTSPRLTKLAMRCGWLPIQPPRSAAWLPPSPSPRAPPPWTHSWPASRWTAPCPPRSRAAACRCWATRCRPPTPAGRRPTSKAFGRLSRPACTGSSCATGPHCLTSRRSARACRTRPSCWTTLGGTAGRPTISRHGPRRSRPWRDVARMSWQSLAPSRSGAAGNVGRGRTSTSPCGSLALTACCTSQTGSSKRRSASTTAAP
mmetsp:Transcript_147317/g.455735  ORF Transcript_147317/g.455735 Transcript_147317/m.455735 type:complete len:212 (+) Transcript_147317:194-829(+)